MENTLQKWQILHDCEAVKAILKMNTNFADGDFVPCIVFVVTSFLTPNFSCQKRANNRHPLNVADIYLNGNAGMNDKAELIIQMCGGQAVN